MQDQQRITELIARREATTLALIRAEEQLTKLQQELSALDAQMRVEEARANLPCWNCKLGEEARFQLSRSSDAFEIPIRAAVALLQSFRARTWTH